MVRLVSTRLALASLALSFVALAPGCVNPKDRLGEFEDRVPAIDAPVVGGMCHDISGQWLAVINPKQIQDGSLIYLIADVTLNENGAQFTVDVTLRALDFMTLQEIPDSSLEFTGAAVDCDTGRFTLTLTEATIPADANPIILGAPIVITGAVEAVIVRENHWCGDLTGTSVLTGTSLDGTKFGARRIADGTIGDDLPDPVSECQEEDFELIDAGVPDVDAGIDGSVPDANR